jgi:hypothetical protein
MFSGEALETFKGLKLYLETLEGFIEGERAQEISELEKHAEQWEAVHQEDFWAWHYPVHWDEIFANQLRSSFVITLMSLAESHVGMVAEQAYAIVGASITPKELRKSPLFERNRKRLEELAGFTRPDDKSWESLYEVRTVRNCIVHAGSRIYDSRTPERVQALVGTLPGLSAPYEVLELAREFPVHSFKVVEGFLTDLYDEASALCRRVSTANTNP